MYSEIALKIFGTGGILVACYYWCSLWAGRRRIVASILRETYNPNESSFLEVTLELEVTNLGDKPTALNDKIVVKASTPNGERRKFVLEVQEENRELPSNSPRRFLASGELQAVFPFSWFRRYKVRVTRGRGINILRRNADGADIGFFRYWFEYCMFSWFGKLH